MLRRAGLARLSRYRIPDHDDQALVRGAPWQPCSIGTTWRSYLESAPNDRAAAAVAAGGIDVALLDIEMPEAWPVDGRAVSAAKHELPAQPHRHHLRTTRVPRAHWKPERRAFVKDTRHRNWPNPQDPYGPAGGGRPWPESILGPNR